MPSSVIRVNQAGYAAGLPVRAAVLKEGPVILENENGDRFYAVGKEEDKEDGS